MDYLSIPVLQKLTSLCFSQRIESASETPRKWVADRLDYLVRRTMEEEFGPYGVSPLPSEVLTAFEFSDVEEDRMTYTASLKAKWVPESNKALFVGGQRDEEIHVFNKDMPRSRITLEWYEGGFWNPASWEHASTPVPTRTLTYELAGYAPHEQAWVYELSDDV